MKTLNRVLVTATLAAGALVLCRPAAADHVTISGGVVFGGHSDHSTWQVGIGTGGVGVGVAVGGRHGWRHHYRPVVVPAPVVVPRPVTVVHQPVIVAPAPVVYAPVVAAVPAPVRRARVVEYISPYRRVSQPMIHGHMAVVEVRNSAEQPWVVVAEHPSIW